MLIRLPHIISIIIIMLSSTLKHIKLNSRQDMNMLNSLVALFSNIHHSYLLALSRSKGAAGMLSTSNYNLTSDAIFLVETAW